MNLRYIGDQPLCIGRLRLQHDLVRLAVFHKLPVYIMEHGKFVECGKPDKVMLTPDAPYTKRLISDVPKIHEPWDLSTVDLLGNEKKPEKKDA